MANEVLSTQKIPVADKDGDFKEIIKKVIFMDTTASDLTVHTPSDSGNMIGVFGAHWAEADDCNIEWKSGEENVIVVSQMPASSGFDMPLSATPSAIITNPGEPLVIRMTGNPIAYMVLLLAEFQKLTVR